MLEAGARVWTEVFADTPFAQPSEALALAGQGQISRAVEAYLLHHGRRPTLEHVSRVAAEAGRLARQFGLEAAGAELAGWLHDISAVVPNSERIDLAQRLEIEMLPEEAGSPLLIHQKLSAVMAQALFGVNDRQVLNAIGCHTTLKAQAGPLDLAVFVADKLAWDQPGEPPLQRQMLEALEHSLARAALVYLNDIWERRTELPAPLHPWASEARQDLQASQVA